MCTVTFFAQYFASATPARGGQGADSFIAQVNGRALPLIGQTHDRLPKPNSSLQHQLRPGC